MSLTDGDEVDVVPFDLTCRLLGFLGAGGLAVRDDDADLLDPGSGALQEVRESAHSVRREENRSIPPTHTRLGGEPLSIKLGCLKES